MTFIIKYWKIIVYVVSVIAAYVFGALIHPGTIPGGVNATNTNAGNQIVYLTNITDMTNNITNTQTVWTDYQHYSTDPFVFVQRDNVMSVSLWKRSASQKIEQWQSDNGLILGVGWDAMRTAPAGLAGWHWKNLGVISTATISTNFGISVFGVWMFN